MTQKPKFGILFDMDGVIIDNNTYHIEAWKVFCAKYGMEMTEDNYRKNVNGRTAADIITNLFGDNVNPAEIKSYSNEKESIYRDLYRPHLAPTPGLLDLLELLKSLDIPMAVGTSAPTENANFILDGLAIRHYFTAVLDENNVTKGKPDPQIYLKASAAINRSAANCIVFEDAVLGIEAGKAAGCKVIGVTTSHSANELPETNMKINDFTEITVGQLELLFTAE
jgi:beta-phosphoglucomutase family hydrolase